MTHVVLLLAPQVHLLDVSGPAQVLTTAAAQGGPWRVSYVGEQDVVPSRQGLPLTTVTTWPELTSQDLILVPGWGIDWDRPAEVPLSGESLERLVAHHRAGGVVGSICAGALALGGAGLLDARRCTTHFAVTEVLAAANPAATVLRDVLYVEDDRILTSAGIASGIDLALHLVATRQGPAAAARVARELVVYARRNGDDPQQSAMLRHRSHLVDVVHEVQDVIDQRFAEPLPLGDLARRVGVSTRTLTRAFGQATGTTPLRYQQQLRREQADQMIAGGATVESAARAVGFEDARMLRRLRADRRLEISPST